MRSFIVALAVSFAFSMGIFAQSDHKPVDKPQSPRSLSNLDSIREVLLNRVISFDFQDIKVACVAVDGDKDPSQALFERITDERLQFRKNSDRIKTHRIVDRISKAQAVQFSVSKIRKKNPERGDCVRWKLSRKHGCKRLHLRAQESRGQVDNNRRIRVLDFISPV